MSTNNTATGEQGVDASSQVLEAIAAETDRDVLELPPLYDEIDPEPLDRLFSPTTGANVFQGTIRFRYADYLVAVTRDPTATDKISVTVAEASN